MAVRVREERSREALTPGDWELGHESGPGRQAEPPVRCRAWVDGDPEARSRTQKTLEAQEETGTREARQSS